MISAHPGTPSRRRGCAWPGLSGIGVVAVPPRKLGAVMISARPGTPSRRRGRAWSRLSGIGVAARPPRKLGER